MIVDNLFRFIHHIDHSEFNVPQNILFFYCNSAVVSQFIASIQNSTNSVFNDLSIIINLRNGYHLINERNKYRILSIFDFEFQPGT